jgi:catechol 2,3-dioxygenase-like lactoylglutathione lyase family enzyme
MLARRPPEVHMSVEMNGIAHIQLSVNDAARCLPFWERFCHFLSMKTLIKNADIIYCIGSRTGILVRAAATEHRATKFDQTRAGLHHFCFRARSNEDVAAVHEFLRSEPDVKILRAPEAGPWAPGYYSILFEDPDGIRVEVNHVPGRGHFGPEGQLGSGQGPLGKLEGT